MKEFNSINEVVAAEGEDLGTSSWVSVEQDRIDAFAGATGDHQWIHIDAERAKAESHFARQFLVLSLIPALSKDNFVVRGAKMAVNYGLNKVRFMTPVPTGSRVRLNSRAVTVEKVADNIVNLTVRHTVEVEDSERPAAVADLIARYVF
jgi:acyl dehydratase